MGCCSSKSAAIQGLKDEIKALQEQKSRLLIEKDSLKESISIYSLSNEEIAFMLRRLTNDCQELESELERLDTVHQQSVDLTNHINTLDSTIANSEKDYKNLQHLLAQQKELSLAKTEELNELLKEASVCSFEVKSKSKEFQDLRLAVQENNFLEEKKRLLKEKIEVFQDVNEKVNKNSVEIFKLERKIKEITPQIDSQNKLHKELMEVDEEIAKLREDERKLKISESEERYYKEIYGKIEKMREKCENIDKEWREIDAISVEMISEEMENYALMIDGLIQEIDNATNEENDEFVKMSKMSQKKTKILKTYNQRAIEFEKEYERVSAKLQKKQAAKVLLEMQLKEFKTITKDINI
jgi:hypothetical protein